MLLFLIFKFLEQIITEAPLLMASLTNFSPFILFPLIAKNMLFFLTFLLLDEESRNYDVFFTLWDIFN